MTADTLVLWRHGRTEWNASARLQGQTDIPLDAVGLWQAQESAAVIAAVHAPALVVTSDLDRAARTAQRLGEVSGARVVTDPRVRERSFGLWEGVTREELEADWPVEFAAWRRGEEPAVTGAESRADVAARVSAAVQEHLAGLEAGETLVVVTHGAAITLGLTALLGLDPATWRGLNGPRNAHWSIVQRTTVPGRSYWRLMQHNIGPDFPHEHWENGPDWNSEVSSA